MTNRLPEEGDTCLYCEGVLEYMTEGSCSCHINPPCSACVNSILTCPICGEEYPDAS